MTKVLIPFAEPEGAHRAIDVLLGEPLDPLLSVHLVAQVEALRPGKVAMFVTRERAYSLVHEAARRWLGPLEARLEALRIPFTTEIAIGAPRATIAELTQRADIDRVLLPPPGAGGFSRRDGERIRDLSPHPVTLVA